MNAATRLQPALVSTFVAAVLTALLVVVTPASGGPATITVTTTNIAQGATVSGALPWAANATGNVKSVDFYVDGQLKWSERRAPYTYSADGLDGKLDTTRLADGAHSLKVIAREPSGPTATHELTVTVKNSAAPSAWTTSPAAGATVSGVISWNAATSGVITRVAFSIDGVDKTWDYTSPYAYAGNGQLDTTALSAGSHTLGVRAEGPSGSKSSSITVTVANGATKPTNTSAPTIAGAAAVGQTLTGSTGSWSGTAPLTYSRGWERCVSATCSPISGATAATYTLVSADAGATIKHVVTATNSAGSTTARSSATAAVASASTSTAPVNTVLPAISGSAHVGQTLTGTTGTWTSSTAVTYARSWERCMSGSCSPISGATAGTYTLVAADEGATLKHAVTATNSVGSTVARSVATATVQTTSTSTTFGTSLPARMPESTGTSYYVDGSRGSDSNPGTLSLPWRTINKALSSVPLSGSIVNVRAGTYYGMHEFKLRNAPASNPVTIQPYPGERVLLTAASGSGLHAFLVNRASGIRIRGFEITSPGALDGVKVESSNDVEIVGNEIHHTGRQGVIVAGMYTTPGQTGTRNVQIWGNRFHDNGSDGKYDHSVYFGGVLSNTDGIDHTSYGGVIANNVFYNQPVGYQLQIGSSVSGLIVTNNTFYRAFGPYPSGGSIVLYSECQTPAYVTRYVTIVNNLITSSARWGTLGIGGGLMSTNVVRNNLSYGHASGDFYNGGGATFSLGSNFTGQSALFANAGGNDFRLQAGSPAIGRADPAYAPPKDVTGRARSGAAELGAYEY